MSRIVSCRSCQHHFDNYLLDEIECKLGMDMDKACYFVECPEYIEEVKICPICDRVPRAETYPKGIRYRCPGCGDSSELCITLAQAAESWNAGITGEYMIEVRGEYI